MTAKESGASDAARSETSFTMIESDVTSYGHDSTYPRILQFPEDCQLTLEEVKNFSANREAKNKQLLSVNIIRKINDKLRDGVMHDDWNLGLSVGEHDLRDFNWKQNFKHHPDLLDPINVDIKNHYVEMGFTVKKLCCTCGPLNIMQLSMSEKAKLLETLRVSYDFTA